MEARWVGDWSSRPADHRYYGTNRRLRLCVGALCVIVVLLALSLAPFAQKAEAYVAYSWGGESKIPTYEQGVQATFNTVNPTVATDSAVAYFVSVEFTDGSWLQVGYLKGSYLATPHGGSYQATVPTVYVEYNGGGGAMVSTYQTLAVGTTHSYMIKRTGSDVYGHWIWSAYVDGVLKLSRAFMVAENAAEILAEGESHDTSDSSTSHVYFTSLQQYEITYPRRGAVIQKWHPWDGYSDILCGSFAGWNIVPGANSFEVWMT